jgi:hypothetical protein
MKWGLRNLFVAISLAASLPLAAGCFGMENVQVINDPFLGPTRGFVMYLDLMGYTAVSMKEAQGKYTLQVMVVQPGVANAAAAVGDKAEFLVGTSVLALENAVEAQPVANHVGETVFTQWQLTFKLDAQQAARFAAGPLGAIKAHVGSLEFQLVVSPSKGAKFQQNLAIMTSPPGAAVAATPAH